MDGLEVLRLSLRYIHLVGMAFVLGGVAVQLIAKQYRINTAMVMGIVIQLATGLALAAPLGRDEAPDGAKIAVKLVLAIMLAVMIIVPRKKEHVAKAHMEGIGLFALLTVAVATFWT